MRYLTVVWLIFNLFISAALAQAATNQFTISVTGGSDTTPPTTPTLLSAIPVSSDQINLVWSAVTDDTFLKGYTVWRNGTVVATTTATSYFDTGLVASTSYTYFVKAFDASGNYSSSSNSLSTSTLPAPITPSVGSSTSSNRTESTAAKVVIKDLRVEAGSTTATIKIVTSHPARFEVRWGRTGSYELGYVVSGYYATKQSILLTDLEPGTAYEFEVIGYTEAGFPSSSYTGVFTSKEPASFTAPENVRFFTAYQEGRDVVLSWASPLNTAVEKVRVVRSYLGFPEHPQDGAIIYQGLKTRFLDQGILNKYDTVYYTAFVYDKNGKVSSGAVALVRYSQDWENYTKKDKSDLSSQKGSKKEGDLSAPAPKATSSVTKERVTAGMKMPTLSEIEIEQDSVRFNLDNKYIIELDAQKPFWVMIPKSKIAGNLKTILVSVLDPKEGRQNYSYLLRLNQDRSAYEAVVPALGVVGHSQITVDIYDYEAFVVATYKAPVDFIGATVSVGKDKPTIIFPDVFLTKMAFIYYCLLVLVLILVLFWHRRRRQS